MPGQDCCTERRYPVDLRSCFRIVGGAWPGGVPVVPLLLLLSVNVAFQGCVTAQPAEWSCGLSSSSTGAPIPIRCVNGTLLPSFNDTSADLYTYVGQVAFIEAHRIKPRSSYPPLELLRLATDLFAALRKDLEGNCALLRNIDICFTPLAPFSLSESASCYKGNSLLWECASAMRFRFPGSQFSAEHNATLLEYFLENMQADTSHVLQNFSLDVEGALNPTSSNLSDFESIIAALSLVKTKSVDNDPGSSPHSTLRNLTISGIYMPDIYLDDVFTALPRLQSVSLPNNAISNIFTSATPIVAGEDSIPSANLKSLNLAGNHLQSIPDNLLFLLPDTTSLDLSNNRLTSFSPTLVFNAQLVKSQITIHLNGNNLAWMNMGPMFDKSHIRGTASRREPIFNLHDNPWHCTCSLWSVRLILLIPPHDRRVQCANLNNRSLVDVTYSELCPDGVVLWNASASSPPDALGSDGGYLGNRAYIVSGDAMFLACNTSLAEWARLLCYTVGLTNVEPVNSTLHELPLGSPVSTRAVRYMRLGNCSNTSVSIGQCMSQQGMSCGKLNGPASISCRVPPRNAPAPSVIPRVKSDQNQSRVVTWTPLLTKDWGSQPKDYLVTYRDAMDSRLTSSIAVPPNQTSVLLPHSLPGRLYKVSVMPRTRLMQAPLSVNGSCLGDSLPRLQEVVLAPGRPAAPVITSLTIDADNVVTLSWQQLLDEEWNGVPTSYHVKLFIVNASEVNAHGTQLQLKILNTSVNSFSFDLNRTVPSSLADHNLFRVGVRAMNHDVRGQQHWVGHLSSRLIWSKCIEPVQNLSSVIEWHNEGILISWTYPRARGDSGLLAPSEDGDAMFFYDLEVCSSSSCLHHRAVSGTLNYTIALSQSRLCDVRNVSVRPCTGLDRTLCGDPRMFWWQQQPLEVLFSDQDTLVEIAGSYQYYWSVDISLAPYEVGLENKSSEVLALYIDYLQGNRSFKQQAVLFDVGSADTLNLSTATRELEFGARHVFSYAVFTADLPPAHAVAFDASNSSRDTRQLSPAPPANWSLDTGSGKVDLELPTDDTIPGAFYQVMAMPVSADVVPVRHRLQTRHRARRQVAASASGTAASVSEPIPGLVDGVQYEIWVQRCVPLPSPSTETACGSWSDRKWVVAGIAAATSPPTTSATVSSSSQATTTPTVELLPPTASSGTSFSTLLTIGIAAFVGLLCVVVSLIFFCKGRQYRRDNLMKTSSPHSPYDYTSIASPMNHGNGSVLHPKITMIKEKHLQLTDILGHGEFGNVHKGQYTGDGGRAQVIAAKVLKDQAGDEDKQALLEEITLMSVIAEQGEHENVIGMVVGGFFRGLPCMVMEYMDIGDLHSYLDRHRLSHDPKSSNLAVLCTTLSSKELMSFASQVARGMEHLSVKVQVVHRDLAARNILIQSTGGDQLNLKVADFGLARSIYRRINYKRAKGTRVPLKWLAIESLREDIYTAASDVWSFGILMWEIVTLGGHPYPGIPLGRLCQFLESGYRMARPRYCSREVYSMMRRCWEADPKLRPSFTELVDQLDILLASSAGYIHVEANIHAVQPDIIDEVSDSDSDADSPAQRWPMDAYSELTTPGFACTPDGYLAPKDSGPAFIMPDPLPASSNGDVRGIATGGADDIESGAAVDGGGGSGVHSRQGSRRGASRRQSSVKSHRTSVVQSLLPSAIQRMISSAAGSIFRAPSVDSLDRGLAKTQQQQQQQASAEASTSSMATANGLRSPRSLIQRRHSSSDVPSDDSSVTLTDIRRLSSTDSSSNADKCDGSAAVARSTSNASNKPAVVSRLNWPSKLTSQRESVEYTTVVSPPVAVHAVKPANTPPSKPALPPKPPRVVVSPKNSASSSASPRGSRRKPNLVLPGYIQPSPAVSNESIARSKAGSQDTLGDVFESKSNSVESLSRLPANPISQSYGSQGSSHLTQVKPASSLPSLG